MMCSRRGNAKKEVRWEGGGIFPRACANPDKGPSKKNKGKARGRLSPGNRVREGIVRLEEENSDRVQGAF